MNLIIVKLSNVDLRSFKIFGELNKNKISRERITILKGPKEFILWSDNIDGMTVHLGIHISISSEIHKEVIVIVSSVEIIEYLKKKYGGIANDKIY
ncbi:hypothetical protein H8356DRAFT_1331680 [Neocallimastix lanati (nom. inval.)]|nr:hypothetical protein H8356DRAFT_1331680 [Neocallimastix sp. JGI-2020a]